MRDGYRNFAANLSEKVIADSGFADQSDVGECYERAWERETKVIGAAIEVLGITHKETLPFLFGCLASDNACAESNSLREALRSSSKKLETNYNSLEEKLTGIRIRSEERVQAAFPAYASYMIDQVRAIRGLQSLFLASSRPHEHELFEYLILRVENAYGETARAVQQRRGVKLISRQLDL